MAAISTNRRPKLREHQRSGLVMVGAMLGLMWASEILDTLLGGRLDGFGIVAWRLSGLDGILFAPFLHSGFGHLIANTVPFVLLGAIIALSGAARVLAVTVIVGVVGGLGTWLTGSPNSLHIGASGLVLGFAAYVIARGAFSRRLGQLLLGALVAVLWGGSLLLSLLPREGISWQGHLFGAVGGVLAACWLDRRGAEPRRA